MSVHIRTAGWQRILTGILSAALVIAQWPPAFGPLIAEASHLGSTTASSGSVPPPTVQAVQAFQPDLFTGRATTYIPIAVPPGRKGIQPSLALSYSSSSRNGWLGVGWSLDLGYIEINTKLGVPKYDGSDSYTFLFQGVMSELVRLSDGTYRAKDEGLFLRFVKAPEGYWEVTDKSGTTYLFGQTSDTRIEDGGRIFRWALNKVVDLNGNTLEVTYTKDANQLYLSQIDYTGHEVEGTQDLAPSNQVRFTLEDRSDIDTSYRAGFEVKTVKRLKQIEAYATVDSVLSLARKYVFTYTTSGRTSRSLLSSIQQFGTDGITSLPPVTFTYQDTGSASYPSVLSNFIPPPSVAGWNIRKANLDTGHEVGPCAHPYAGLPWGSSIQSSGGFDIGCVSGSVSGNGDVNMSGCNDHYGHVWTYVYTSVAKTISLSHTSANDAVACLYKEDAGGVSQVTNAGSISLQAGWSLLHITGYHQHQGWGPTTLSGGVKDQVEVMNPSQIALGVPQLAGDVNGDAKTDLIKFDPQTGSWTVSCATSCTLPPPGTWLSGFGSSSSSPLLGDWNGDGQTDIGTYASGSWAFARSTGTSFVVESGWNLSFGSGTPLTGDFNGDGNTDIGTYSDGSWSIALWNGAGFTSDGDFSLSWGDSGYEAYTGDFNGDGLTDIGIVNESSGSIDVRFSTGSGWTSPTNWIGSFGGGLPHTSADFNGDGLTDAVYYNRSAGQLLYAPSTGSSFGGSVTLPVTFSLTSTNDNPQVADFNGDGIADPAVFNLISGSSQLALSSLTNGDGSNGTAPDVLRTITNGLGGMTAITYQPSSLCGCEEESLLPFVLPVVQQATVSDGLGQSYTTTYLFHDGRYDTASKEFRGFAEATVFGPEGIKSITHFHQDERKGRPYHTEVRDQYDNLWTASDQTWVATMPYPEASEARFVQLTQTDSFTYDGDATFRQTHSRLSYDSYGNLLRTDEDGEVTVSGDERSTITAYLYNTDVWILNKPSLTQTLDVNGAVVAQRRFIYDDNPDHLTPPTVGNLTTEEEWLNLPTEQWLATSMTYDPYGNVKTVIDALDRTTTNDYDPLSFTFLETVTNTLGHAQQAAYDARLGQAVRATDPNDVITTTEYDALGRVVKVIGPEDTVELPTLRYEYDLSTIPAKTTVYARIQSGQPEELVTYTFTDGLGRTIQTRLPAEDPTKHVVRGVVEFNTRGQAAKQWVPYFSSLSSTYVPLVYEPNWEDLAAVSYTYDPLGRTTAITDPDGSPTTTTYDDWTVTTTDAEGHQTVRRSDAYGRLIQVEEHNEDEVYSTIYTYDTLNNLIQVTDAANHVTSITYDSLSRKIAMDDPDMSHWEYTYDEVDNLIHQVDASEATLDFTYDELNRLVTKIATPGGFRSAPQSPVTYEYDAEAKPYAKGKLSAISDAQGSSDFEYDRLGRLTKESRVVIGGQSYTLQRTYDLLGRLTSLRYPDGDIIKYTYNNQGGLEQVYSDPYGDPEWQTWYVTNVDYNAAGQMLRIEYGNGTVSDYTYNPQTLRLDQLVSTGPSGLLQDLTYQFDRVGNVTQIADAVTGNTQDLLYDDLNRLIQASGQYGVLSYAYDALGNMTQKDGISMSYGENGAPPHAVTSTAEGWTMTYDANGNLDSKTHTDSGQHFFYTYDEEHRLTQVELRHNPETTVSIALEPGWNFITLPVDVANKSVDAVMSSLRYGFDYNQLSRYDTATQTWETYFHDPEFNEFDTMALGEGYAIHCTTAVTWTMTGTPLVLRQSRQLFQGRNLIGVPSDTALLVEDALAGLVLGSDYQVVYHYNAQTQSWEHYDGITNDFTTFEPGQGYWLSFLPQQAKYWELPTAIETVSFSYDGDGGRTSKTTKDGTTIYVGEVLEIAPDTTWTKSIFAGSQRVAIERILPQIPHPVEHFWYLSDHLGSANVITDEDGNVVQRLDYTPYGTVWRNDGSRDFEHKFTGQRLDPETNLYYYKARYYDPHLGRFIQPDTIVKTPGDPQILNRYSYARNNPLKYIDPSGQFIEWIIGLLIAMLISVAVELTISFLNLEGGWAKALRFIGTAASVAVGGFTAGLDKIVVGRLVAAGAYTTLALDTGEGRQLTKSFAEGLQDLGVGRKASYIIASTVLHSVTSSAIFVGFSTVSPIPAPGQGPPTELPKDGEGGRTVGDMKARNTSGTRIEPAGEGYLASAPAFGDAAPKSLLDYISAPFQKLAEWTGVRHSAFVGPTGQDTATRAFPFIFPGAGTCHQQTFGGLISQSGLSGVKALAIMGREAGWTFFLTSAVYGVHGSLGLQGLMSSATQIAAGDQP